MAEIDSDKALRLAEMIALALRSVDRNVTCSDYNGGYDGQDRSPTGDDYNRLWDAVCNAVTRTIPTFNIDAAIKGPDH